MSTKNLYTTIFSVSDIMEQHVITEVKNQLGIITLDRALALNSLTLAMVRDITRTLLTWRDDANITAVVNASTKAWIGAGVIVTAFANAAAASIYSGLSDRSNNPLMDATFKGVAVTATSREDVTGVSVAGAGGSTGGGAGSASATQYDRTTSAIIYKNAQINTLTTLPAGAVAINPVIGALQSVRVLASSLSNLTLGAGSLAIGGTGGIGVGINAGVINKTTLAQIENGKYPHINMIHISPDYTCVVDGKVFSL